MAYSTQSDLLNRITEAELIQLTDDAGAGTVDAGKVTKAIEAADALIDSYAGGTNKIQLVVTDQVRSLSVDLAIFELEKRRRVPRAATKEAKDAAVAFLKDVAARRATLRGQVAGVATSQTTGLDVKKKDRTAQEDTQKFSPENIGEY